MPPAPCSLSNRCSSGKRKRGSSRTSRSSSSSEAISEASELSTTLSFSALRECRVGPRWEHLTGPLDVESEIAVCPCSRHRDMTFQDIYGVFEELYEHFIVQWGEMDTFHERLGIATKSFEEFFHAEMAKLGWVACPVPTLQDIELFHLPPSPFSLWDCDPPAEINYEEYVSEFQRLSDDIVHNL